MQFEGQQRLFAGQVVAVDIQIYRDGPYGWTVRINDRRDLEAWSERPAAFYAELHTTELADVLCSELERVLSSLTA